MGYTDLYAPLFDGIREDVTKVLEIGVETGRSHRLWLEYFPNATIYGFDIFTYGSEELHRLQKGNPNLDRSVMFKGDQERVDDLEEFLCNIAQYENVVTNTYHGAYWAILLGCKVILQPWSSKFNDLGFNYGTIKNNVSNYREILATIKPNNNALDIAKDANKKFFTSCEYLI